LKILIEHEKQDCYYASMPGVYEKRVHELEDDSALAQRLKSIELLVYNGQLDPPNALDVIRFRQCGILRWLEGANFLKLNDLVAGDKQFHMSQARKVQFLGGKKCPVSIQTSVFLSFAAVEFDNLQSLQWILEKCPVLAENHVIGGLNLAQCSLWSP
jgi:hypothetical protein